MREACARTRARTGCGGDDANRRRQASERPSRRRARERQRRRRREAWRPLARRHHPPRCPPAHTRAHASAIAAFPSHRLNPMRSQRSAFIGARSARVVGCRRYAPRGARCALAVCALISCRVCVFAYRISRVFSSLECGRERVCSRADNAAMGGVSAFVVAVSSYASVAAVCLGVAPCRRRRRQRGQEQIPQF